jgi:DNA repair protein RecO (recombination protein O)
MIEKVEGIIIKTTDYSETHKIVTIFTREKGKIGLVARGAKKPRSRMAALAQPFIYGVFLFQAGRNLGTLQQGEILHSMRNIREDLTKTAYAAYLAELTDKILDHNEPDPQLWDQLLHTYERLLTDEHPEIITMIYELKIFAKGGFAPVLDGCVNCGTTNNSLQHFSISEGGFLCGNCRFKDPHAIYLTEKFYRVLRTLRYANVDQIGSVSIKDENKKRLRTLLNDYYDQYGGFYLKSRKFLQQLDSLKFD